MAILSPNTGVLLVGHGSRSSVAVEAFLALARVVSESLAPVPLEPAFLELAEPTIGAALRRLVDRGVEEIVISPLLLFSAGHAKEDIPIAIEQARNELGLPPLRFHQAEPLGLRGAIVELSRLRFTESLRDRPAIARDQTCLVLVGRGSSDAEAIAEMHELARLRGQPAEVSAIRVAFVAVARPSVAEVLAQVAHECWQRVIIQPHLLLPGEVLESIERDVANIAAKHPEREWLISPLLAKNPHGNALATDLLLGAIVDRIHEATAKIAS